MNQLEGVLAVHKPAGWTSHDVVAKLRGLLKIKRIGHAGTLDPDVTGVLPLAVGRATRIIEYLQDMPKEYIAQMTVGYETDTEDNSGRVMKRADAVAFDRRQLESAVSQFIGDISQVPPMYSAVKVDGQRLYDIARQGLQVERKPRTVTIHEIHIEGIDEEDGYPRVTLRVLCSKGTYIRTLCKDIGHELGYPAVMSGLIRTMSCGIPLTRCLTMERIRDLHEAGELAEHILATDEALPHLQAVHLDERSANRLLQGQKLRIDRASIHTDGEPDANGLVRLYAPGRRFIGIGNTDRGLLIPQKMFHS